MTIVLRRARDGQLVMPITANSEHLIVQLMTSRCSLSVATIFADVLNKAPKRPSNVKIENNQVTIMSSGRVHFQFAMQQYVHLHEREQVQDLTQVYKRLNIAAPTRSS